MDKIKSLFTLIGTLTLIFTFSNVGHAQTKDATIIKTEDTTPGCKPSSCRGAQTKFHEAAVITNLRKEVVDLKIQMETTGKLDVSSNKKPKIELYGADDEESLLLIKKEVEWIQQVFSKTFDKEFKALELTDNKAKIVRDLKLRIKELKDLL